MPGIDFLNKLRPQAVAPTTGAPEIEKNGSIVNEPTVVEAELSKNIKSVPEEDSDNEELIHKDMQPGIQKAEGMAQVWPRWAMYFTYAW
jgi:hypothetical protein